MRAHTWAVVTPVLVTLVGLSMIAASSAGALGDDEGGDGGEPTPQPQVAIPKADAETALNELEALSGASLAAATNDPDNGYSPLPVTRNFGPDGTAAAEEGNTRVDERPTRERDRPDGRRRARGCEGHCGCLPRQARTRLSAGRGVGARHGRQRAHARGPRHGHVERRRSPRGHPGRQERRRARDGGGASDPPPGRASVAERRLREDRRRGGAVASRDAEEEGPDRRDGQAALRRERDHEPDELEDHGRQEAGEARQRVRRTGEVHLHRARPAA